MSYTPPLDAEVTAFKTTTPLAAAATYDSSTVDWDGDVSGYSQVQTEILSNQTGTIDIDFCEDAAFAVVVRTLSIPYSAVNEYQFFAAPAFGNFIRYKFTNTSGVTNTIYYTTKLLTTAISPQLLTTDAFIAPAMVTTLNRSISVGQDPNDTFVNSPQGGVHDGNSSTTALGIGGIFPGTFVDTEGYSATSIFIKADQDSAAGGLQIIHSSDGVTDERIISFSYIAADNPQGLVYMIPASTRYFRLKYINGGVAQGAFVTSVKNETTALQTIALPVNLPITNNTLSNVTKSVIIGKNDAGNYGNVPVDDKGHLEVNVTNPNTAYDEVSVAQLTPINQVSFPYNINPDLVTTIETNGTVTQDNNMALVSTGAGALVIQSASLESKYTTPFRAGQGALARFSALFTKIGGGNGPTSIQGIGMGDANDGYGFALIGDVMNVSYRTNGAGNPPPGNQTNVAQTLWNNDVMDGTGSLSNPSGMLLDPTQGNVYQISYGSGFGCINFSIESDVTGRMILVHVLHLANSQSVPSAYNPSFALRAEVFKVGTSDPNDYILSVADMSSFVEGVSEVTGPTNGFTNTKAADDTNPVTNMTLYNTATFASKTNKVSCLLKTISFSTSAEPGFVKIIEGGTLTGAGTPVDISTNASVIATDTAISGISGGRVLWVGAFGKDGGQSIDLTNLNLRMIPGQNYTITHTLNVNGGQPVVVGIVWQEDF